MTAKLLFDEEPLVVQPTLAALIGLEEAIIVQQLHYWLRKSDNIFDGRPWVYNTYDEWHDQFPFLKKRTIQRIFLALEKDGIIITGNYNKAKFDNTKWYSLDYARLNRLRKCDDDSANLALRTSTTGAVDDSGLAHGTYAKVDMDSANLAPPIPENTTETNSENTQRLKPPTPTSARADDASLIWTRCLEQLQTKMGQASFQTWFFGSRGYDYSDKTLTVIVPNAFAKDQIMARYTKLVNDTLKELSKGQEIKVQYILLSEGGAGGYEPGPSPI